MLRFVAFFIVASTTCVLRAAPPVDFVSDIQPILAEHCTHCHGVDEQSRKSGLRLDLQSGAYTGGDSGEPAIVPGSPDEGSFLARITSDDEFEVMPPPHENKPLSEKQIELLKAWIEQGAKYDEHWAFVAPQKAELNTEFGQHPIDALVRANLDQVGLQPSPAETSEILCRRVYLDIIGLPPSLEQLEEFERDGLRATVEKLLQSDRYGEKWARHWLDVARYSDTNGYEKDLRRDQWIWRDWVINALNKDMPYDQFVIEQIAGDLLPNATQDQTIATGFLRNSMINEEGAIVPEQFRMVEMFDRMDCVGKAVLGLTTQCAQCHNHKFDPLSQAEYYGMFAYLNDVYDAQSWIYNDQQLQKLSEVRNGINTVYDQIRSQRNDWQNEVNEFASKLISEQADWQPIKFHQLESVSGLNHPVQLSDDSILMLGHSSADIFYVGKHDLQGVTGLRLEALPHLDLPFGGPGRNSVGSWNVLELEVFIKRPDAQDWEKQKLVNATADFSEPDQKLEEGKKATGPVAYLIDGSDANSWKADRGNGRRNNPSVAVVQFEKPLECPAETEIKVVMRMGDMLGCVRVSTTTSPDPKASNADYAAVLAASIDTEQRSDEDNVDLFEAWIKSVPALESQAAEIETLWKQYPNAMTSVLHLADRDGVHQRSTYMLDRGEWDKPQDEVQPHVPAAFHAMQASDVNDRLSFAKWLVDPRSPLAARVAVNRVWQAIFGDGLVETADDFGTRAPVPEHRELLDWLAVDFMENGWSKKRLIELIVTSETYQQSSAASAEQLSKDPKNRWLARGPRFRADAEVVRDMTLAMSGLITHKIGGPSVIPPVPQNVLDYNYTYPGYWKPASGPERYRRTVYGFRKRSMPDPVMSSFDAPNGDAACARRVRSNTPLAALAGLNETIFVEAGRAFGLKIVREGGPDDRSRANFAFRTCTSRWPTDQEVDVVLHTLAQQRQRIAEGWLNPRELTTGDPGKLPDLPAGTTPQDAAAWTLVARVLLNLDETLSKN